MLGLEKLRFNKPEVTANCYWGLRVEGSEKGSCLEDAVESGPYEPLGNIQVKQTCRIQRLNAS